MARANKTGRSKGGGFLQLHHYMLNSPAWRSLSPQDRSVYLVVAGLYNGKNNGFLAVGVRSAADGANVNKDTASKCFAALIAKGFIECAQPGAFNTNARRATEWRLTHEKCDRSHQAPSKAFLRWRPPPENADQRPKRGTPKSETEGHTAQVISISVPRFRTMPA